jgi:putative endonuclease
VAFLLANIFKGLSCLIAYVEMLYHTYILKSESTGRLYIGQTNNLNDRIKRHNSNQSLSTSKRGPWILIFSKAFETRAKAVKLEMKLKSWKNPEKVLDWMKSLQAG